MTELQRLMTLGALALGTMLTRFIPFWFFPEHKPLPSWLLDIKEKLPYASLGMLLVYALKDTVILSRPYGIPEAIALVWITFIHRWKDNTLLSIFTGLALYLVCVNLWFH